MQLIQRLSLILFLSFSLVPNTYAQFNSFNISVGSSIGMVTNMNQPKNSIIPSSNDNVREYYKSSIGIYILLSTDYSINKKWTLRSGLKYAQYRFNHNVESLLLGTDIINDTKSSMEESGNRIDSGISIDLFFTPTQKNENKQISFFSGLGINKIFVTSDRFWQGAAASDPVFYNKEYDFKRFNITGRIGLKFSLNLHEKWNLSLLPFTEIMLLKDEFILFNGDRDRLIYPGILFEISLLK